MKKLLTVALVAAMVPFAGMAQTPMTAPTPTSPVDANAPLPGANKRHDQSEFMPSDRPWQASEHGGLV
jgi:hypothetical protein